jgi:aspartate-semialdehyde dehydrogenase
MSVNIAIVGASGAVGEGLLEILESRKFPVEKMTLLASERSAGDTRLFRNKNIEIKRLDQFDFTGTDIAFFSAGGNVSEKYAPIAASQGCIVIDNTSHFRYDEDVPLVIPEVNPEDIAAYKNKNIIANPNCSTIQMLVAIKPIYDFYGIRKVNVATYQSVSGAGQSAIEELASQTAELLNAKSPTVSKFPCQLSFNVIAQIDDYQDNGYTKEEMKMHWETQKMLHDDNISVNATAVRVPVFFGHSEAVHIETNKPLGDIEEIKQLLSSQEGVVLVDDVEHTHPVSPITDAANSDEVFISRVRKDFASENGLNLWVVSDNIRKGAALNSVQIAEILVKNYL